MVKYSATLHGYAMSPKRKVQIANPASFLAQQILIREQRDHRDRAKDSLYALRYDRSFLGNSG